MGRSTSATSWSTSRLTSGCASSACRDMSCSSWAPTMPTVPRSCSRPRARASPRRSWWRASRAGGRAISRASTSVSITGTRPTRPRTRSCRRRSTGASRPAASSTRNPSSSSSMRSKACSCPTATSRASARYVTPRTRTGTPARCAAASTRPPISSIRTPRSRVANPSCALPSISSSGSRIRSALPSSGLGWMHPGGCRARSPTRRASGWRARASRHSRTGTSRATPPTSASRFRTLRASTSTCGSMRPSATWRR